MAACVLCGSLGRWQISRIEFWDLAQGDLDKCDRCSHIQLNPPLTDEATAKGCEALYTQLRRTETPAELKRGFYRAFTKGVALGLMLKLRRAKISSMLELGPGDGFVSRGVQVFFPDARVTALDIVNDTLKFVHDVHGYEVIAGTPEQLADHLARYDLVLARDILEHTQNPGHVLRLAYDRLNHGGYLHLITPNGPEDVWPFQLRWEADHKTSELLLNHVQYFDPVGLKQFLTQLGFRKFTYFIYGLKWRRRGRGWKRTEAQKAPVAIHRSTSEALSQGALPEHDWEKLGVRRIAPRWWTKSFLKYPAAAFWWLHHHLQLRVPAKFKIGHEIFCLCRK